MAQKEDNGKTMQDLKAAIKAKQPERFYIFHGVETFLMHHYTQRLQKLLVDELTESFNFHKLTQESFDIRSFAEAVENLPMMAESTFVWVDDVDIFKLPENEREKLREVICDIPDYCTVLFTFETVPWKPDKRFKKLWDAIVNTAQIVEFSKQDQRDLVAWIGRHFSANGKTITPDLCIYLIEITGGTMTALSSEIAKICAYCDAPAVVRSDIDAVVEPVLDAVVFQMTDLLVKGEYGAALQKLHALLKMQEEEVLILGAIGSHVRRLGAARTLLDQGKNYSDLMQLYHGQIWDYQAKKMMSSAKNFTPQFCAAAAQLVMETDRQLKTSYDDAGRLLELLLLRLAQEARNG